jgi:hypothetical protein
MDNQFLFKLNEFLTKELETNEDYQNSVVVMAVEVDKSGRPLGTINKVFAPPFTGLGLLDYMSANLNNLRDGVFDKLEEDQMKISSSNEMDFSELLGKYPPELRSVVEKYDDQLREAIMNGDAEALAELKKLILSELNKLRGGDSGDDDFDMKDFIGGSI